MHLGSGAALGVLLDSPWVALAVLVVYEGVEGLLRRIKVEDGGLFEYESWPNIVVDVLVGWAGFGVVHLLGGPWLPR